VLKLGRVGNAGLIGSLFGYSGDFSPFSAYGLEKGVFLFLRAYRATFRKEQEHMKDSDSQPPSSGGCPFSTMEAAPVMR
jgi:hypothetical protein